MHASPYAYALNPAPPNVNVAPLQVNTMPAYTMQPQYTTMQHSPYHQMQQQQQQQQQAVAYGMPQLHPGSPYAPAHFMHDPHFAVQQMHTHVNSPEAQHQQFIMQQQQLMQYQQQQHQQQQQQLQLHHPSPPHFHPSLHRAPQPIDLTQSPIFSQPLSNGGSVPPQIVNRVRPTSERVIIKLTGHLMETYSAINDRYYANKRKKIQEQQIMQQQNAQRQQQMQLQQMQQAAQAAASSAAASSSNATALPASAAPLASPVGPPGIPLRKGETNDGWSDRDYNYIVTENEILNGGRYQVAHSIGRGSFGRVVKAYDMKESRYVAVKIVKAKNAFYKQAQIEMKLLSSVAKGFNIKPTCLNGTNEENAVTSSSPSPNESQTSSSATGQDQQSEGDKWNIVNMLDSFMHHGHQCIVFELLSLNLYELLRNTRFTGVSLKLIGKFTHQLLMTLAYLSCKERGEERIIHCDLKPENILLRSSKKSSIKVIDLGSACFSHQKVYTYIQSRFYRAPEVICGLPYNAAIDVWSLGCICFELSHGVPLFDGQDEHDQIIRHVDLLGIPPASMIEKSKKGSKFFECVPPIGGGAPVWRLKDPALAGSTSTSAAATYLKISQRAVVDPPLTPLQKLCARITRYQDQPVWNAFINLMMLMLEWDPRKRIKPAQALNHEFFTLLKKQQEAAAAAAAVTTPTATTPSSIADTTSTSQPLSSVFSNAAAAAFTYQPPMHASVDTGIAASSAAAIPPIDTIMTDSVALPTQQHPPITTVHESTAMNVDSQVAQPQPQPQLSETTSMDVDEPERKDTKSTKLQVQPPLSAAQHITPTRKRHSDGSPRSPSSIQGTPKTRAATAAAVAAAQAARNNSFNMQPAHTDSEIEQMHLPPMVYQSPSIKPVNRSLTRQTRSHTHGAIPISRSMQNQSFVFDDVGTSSASSSSSSTVAAAASHGNETSTPRRSSDAPSSISSSAPDSFYQHGVLTRAQKSAILTPLSPGAIHTASANLSRQLASDPLALHLDHPAKAHHPTSASSSPPLGNQLTPSSAASGGMPALALFASPQTLRRHAKTRPGMMTRKQSYEANGNTTEDEDALPITQAQQAPQLPRTPRTRSKGMASPEITPHLDLNDSSAASSSSSDTPRRTSMPSSKKSSPHTPILSSSQPSTTMTTRNRANHNK